MIVAPRCGAAVGLVDGDVGCGGRDRAGSDCDGSSVELESLASERGLRCGDGVTGDCKRGHEDSDSDGDDEEDDEEEDDDDVIAVKEPLAVCVDGGRLVEVAL